MARTEALTSATINSSTQATVSLTIAPTATVGFRNVTGTQSPGGLTHTATDAFEVVAAGSTADVAKEPSPLLGEKAPRDVGMRVPP